MQQMQLMKKKAIGGLLQKRKPIGKPTTPLTPSPKTIGNPRGTNTVPNQMMGDFKQAVMPNVQLQGGRQDALQRMMMRRSPLKQTPMNKFKPIGIPQQPIQQDLYMQRMMQQMQAQQGRYQY